MKKYEKELTKRIHEAKSLEVFGIKVTGKEELTNKLEWLGARIYYLETRAFPFDRMDYSLHRRAIAQRKQMKSKRPNLDPLGIKPQNLESTDYPDSEWAFVGPRNAESAGGGQGPSPIAGRISGIAISYQNPDDVMYVSGGNGGVFKTTDGGDTWTALSNSWDHLYVGDIAVDPTNENIIYVGLGDYDDYTRFGQGMMKSTNGGSTWTLIGEEWDGASVADIIIDPDNHNRILVATGRSDDWDDDGVWLSTNGGTTFTREVNFNKNGLSHSTKVGSTRYYWAVGDNSIRRSTNLTDWDVVSMPDFTVFNDEMAIACSKVDQQTVYLMLNARGRVYKSTNNGEDWSQVSFGSGVSWLDWGQSSYDWYLETSSTDGGTDVIFIGLIDLVTSRNGGTTWVNTGGHSTTGAKLHVDHHVCVPHPTNNEVMFCGTDGGFYRLTYVGSPINQYLVTNAYNDALPITMFYYFAGHPSDAAYFMGGTQDNGTPHSKGDTLNWGTVGGSDGSGVGIAQDAPNIQYRMTQRMSIPSPQVAGDELKVVRTTTSWVTSNIATYATVANETAVFIPPLAVSGGALPDTYVGTQYLYRLNELSGGAFSWNARLGNFKFDERITAIGLAPSDTGTYYVGTANGSVYRSDDSGATWDNIRDSYSKIPTCISVDPSNANSIVVAYTGSDANSNIWRCTNTSVASPAFTDRSGSGSTQLPRIWTNWIERDPWQPTTVWYVGNDIGAFYTDDAGATWYDMTNFFSMPNVSVRELVAVPGANRLYAATYGRGAYRMLISNTRPQVVEVDYPATSVVGGFATVITVTFDQVTPPDGVNLTLAHSPSGIGVIPTTFRVPGGYTSYSFLVQPPVVSNNTTLVTSVTGQYGGNLGDIITVLSHEMTSFNIAPTSVPGSHNATGNVFLNHDAPSGGIAVNLQTDNSAVATVPSTVIVPSGSQVGSFAVATKSVNVTSSADILASFSGTNIFRTITATPINIDGHSIGVSSITGGDNFTGSVSLASPAGPQGVPVNMSSNNPNAQVPAIVTVPNGASSVVYIGTSSLVSPSTVNATITANKGSSFYSDSIALQPVQVSSITFLRNPALPGRPTTMFINLSRAIPDIGLAVNLSSDAPNWLTMPATATGFIGSSSIPVNITPKSTGVGAPPARITITATHMSSSKKAKLIIQGR